MKTAEIERLAQKIADGLDYDDAEDLLEILQSKEDGDRSLLAEFLNEALEGLTGGD